MVSKIVLALALAVSFPIGALGQAAQFPCTPPGFSSGQSLAVNRIGIATPYTLTAVIKSGMLSDKGIETSGGVTTAFQARDGQGRTRIDDPGGCCVENGQPHWMSSVRVNDPVANTLTAWRVAVTLPNHLAYVKSGFTKQVDPATAQQEFDRIRIVAEASDHDPEARAISITKSRISASAPS